MTDEELSVTDATLTARLRNLYARLEGIEQLVKERDAALASNRGLVRLNEAMEARAERLEAALRAIQTYLQEPAPENKLNDLRNDLRWIGNRARAALKGADYE